MTTFDGLPHSLRQPHASHHLVLHDYSPGFPTSRRDHGCRFSHPSVNETDEKTEAIKAHFRRSPGVKKAPGHYRVIVRWEGSRLQSTSVARKNGTISLTCHHRR